ncbi:MAG: hypothetical protein V4618_06330 [Pseudomonadota bacterium]
MRRRSTTPMSQGMRSIGCGRAAPPIQNQLHDLDRLPSTFQ